MQSGNQLKEALKTQAPGKVVPVPEWADMCKQLSEIEEQVNNLKRQIMRFAGQIKGV